MKLGFVQNFAVVDGGPAHDQFQDAFVFRRPANFVQAGFQL